MRSIKSKALAPACILATVCWVPSAAAAAEQQASPPTQTEAPPPPATSDTELPSEAPRAAHESAPGRSAVPQSTGTSKSPDRFEVGIMPRYISNYFESQDEFTGAAAVTPKKSVYITTVSASYEHDFIQRQGSTLTGGLRLRHNFFSNLDGADSNDIDVTLNYNFLPNQLRLAYFGTPRRLVAEPSGHKVFAKTNGFSAEYSHRFGRRLRLRGGYQFERETFSDFQERDLSRHQINGDVRYQFDPLFQPGVGFEYIKANAASENFSYKRPALVIGVTSRLRDVAYFNFRYRASDREYGTDIPADSNFHRDDHRHDLSFYGTLQLGHGLSLFSYGDHTTNDSNHPASSYKNNEVGLGLFYRFPR